MAPPWQSDNINLKQILYQWWTWVKMFRKNSVEHFEDHLIEQEESVGVELSTVLLLLWIEDHSLWIQSTNIIYFWFLTSYELHGTFSSIVDGNIYVIVRLANKFNIKRLTHESIKFIKAQPQPKLLYRQLVDEFGLREVANQLTDRKLATEIPTTDIEEEIAECDLLDSSIPLRVSL